MYVFTITKSDFDKVYQFMVFDFNSNIHFAVVACWTLLYVWNVHIEDFLA